MIIKKMTATFGKLDGAVLELKEGLNILQAPNEGGKSTWCAFLRAVFYGIPTRERDTKTTLAEKNRYAPWSGAPMAGEVLLTWRGRDILLRRFAKGAAPFGGFEAVDAATGEAIPGLNGANCGEVLLGVGREIWQRSAFVGQSGIGVDADPELERRIAALVSSGEEDVSFSETEKTLRGWLNRRKHNKTGLIPRLEEELAALEGAWSAALQNQRCFLYTHFIFPLFQTLFISKVLTMLLYTVFSRTGTVSFIFTISSTVQTGSRSPGGPEKYSRIRAFLFAKTGLAFCLCPVLI